MPHPRCVSCIQPWYQVLFQGRGERGGRSFRATCPFMHIHRHPPAPPLPLPPSPPYISPISVGLKTDETVCTLPVVIDLMCMWQVVWVWAKEKPIFRDSSRSGRGCVPGSVPHGHQRVSAGSGGTRGCATGDQSHHSRRAYVLFGGHSNHSEVSHHNWGKCMRYNSILF